MRYLAVVLCIVSLTLSACHRQLLTGDTVDVSSASGDFTNKQVIENLGRIAEKKFSIPSETYLTSGTAQFTSTLSPSITFPMSSQFARTVSAISGTTTTTNGSGATLGGSLAWQSNFTLSPLQNPFALNNLALLYRAVLFHERNGNGELEVNDYQVPRGYNDKQKLVFNPYYFLYSNCVFCTQSDLPEDILYNIGNNRELKNSLTGKSPKLRLKDALTYKWLFWEEPSGIWHPERPTDKKVVDDFSICYKNPIRSRVPLLYLGSARGYKFYIAQYVPSSDLERLAESCMEGEKLFSEFVLLTLPTLAADVPTPQPKPKSEESQSGKHTKKGKKRSLSSPEHLETFSLPTSTEGSSISLYGNPLVPLPGIQSSPK